MQIHFSDSLESGRAHTALGRIQAVTHWRRADKPVAALDRDIALRALVREAEDFGADALLSVSFEVEEVKSVDIDAVPLLRVKASGQAVRLRAAA